MTRQTSLLTVDGSKGEYVRVQVLGDSLTLTPDQAETFANRLAAAADRVRRDMDD